MNRVIRTYLSNLGTRSITISVRKSSDQGIGMRRYNVSIGGRSMGWLVRWDIRGEWAVYVNNEVLGCGGSKYQGTQVAGTRTMAEGFDEITFHSRYTDELRRSI